MIPPSLAQQALQTGLLQSLGTFSALNISEGAEISHLNTLALRKGYQILQIHKIELRTRPETA